MFKDITIKKNKRKKKGKIGANCGDWEKTDYFIKGKRKSDSIFKYFKSYSSSYDMSLNQGYHRCSAFSKFCRQVSYFSSHDCDLFGPYPQRVCSLEIETRSAQGVGR